MQPLTHSLTHSLTQSMSAGLTETKVDNLLLEHPSKRLLNQVSE